MKHWLITPMLLLMLSGSAGRAADWYDPEGWLDDDEVSVDVEWWTDTVTDGRDYTIYGYDSAPPFGGADWGYGWDYSTVDWYEFDDPFTKWYQKNNDWF